MAVHTKTLNLFDHLLIEFPVVRGRSSSNVLADWDKSALLRDLGLKAITLRIGCIGHFVETEQRCMEQFHLALRDHTRERFLTLQIQTSRRDFNPQRPFTVDGD